MATDTTGFQLPAAFDPQKVAWECALIAAPLPAVP